MHWRRGSAADEVHQEMVSDVIRIQFHYSSKKKTFKSILAKIQILQPNMNLLNIKQ